MHPREYPARSEAPWAPTGSNAPPALGTAQTFAQTIVCITSALCNGSHYVAEEAVTIPELRGGNARMKLGISARLAHGRRQLQRSFCLPHVPGLLRARGQTALILGFPSTLAGRSRHADDSGCVGGAQAVVTGGGPTSEGGSPCNMTGQAENPHEDPPSGCPSKPMASETPNPPPTAPSHMFLSQVRD